MAFIWNAPVGKTSDILEISGKRDLFWYGITVGQVGFGVLVSREHQPTKRAMDGAIGFCECGYMAKYPICTKCGRAYPPRR